MSVKAQALVWDFECPKKIGDQTFKPSHKYVLVCYADHADHNGKNIWPAVITISRKTGLDERSVQRLTRDLVEMGLLVEDGQGPRGTNKWKLPYNEGGDKLSPLTNCQGDKNQKSLGDIPSGDIPSGDKLSPELKEPEPLNINDSEIEHVFSKLLDFLKPDLKGNSWTFLAAARPVSFENNILTLAAGDETARDFLASRLTSTINRAFPAFPNYADARVCFVVAQAQP